MLKKISTFLRDNYFGEQFTLEYRIYMIFFILSYLVSMLSAITNTLLQKGLFGIILQWAYLLICTVVLFIPVKWRMWISKPLLLFMTFFYIPFLFFQTAGFDGTALFFSLLAIFILAIMFKGRQRVVLVGLNIAIYVMISFVQYFFPELVIPHGSMQDKLADLVVALVLSTAGLAIMTVYISNAFSNEQSRIQSLLQELEKSNKTLADITNRDALTGVYNRRYLTYFLQRELDICDRTNANICAMMLDLDNFKQINDTQGHGFGDEVLIKFAQTIQENLRSYDILTRYGGEEFVVVLHAIELETAKKIAERTRIAVSEIVFRNNVKVTVSIGLVQSIRGETIQSIIERADVCLYQAKSAGRNRVVAADIS